MVGVQSVAGKFDIFIIPSLSETSPIPKSKMFYLSVFLNCLRGTLTQGGPHSPRPN